MSQASSPSPRTMKRLWEWQPPPLTTAVAAVARKEEEEEVVRTPQRSALRPEPGRRWVEESTLPDNTLKSAVLVDAAQQQQRAAAATRHSNGNSNGGSFAHLGLLNEHTERAYELPLSPLSPLDSGSDPSPSVDSRPVTERFTIQSPGRIKGNRRSARTPPPYAHTDDAPLLSPSSNTSSPFVQPKKEVCFLAVRTQTLNLLDPLAMD